MLLAALRYTMMTAGTADHVTPYIYASGNPLTGRPDRFRVTLREQDADFFQQHVQKLNGIEQLVTIKTSILPDSRSRIRDNTLLLVEELKNRTEDERQRLARFVINNCYLVVVSTPSFDSAYRIFSILNDRGLNLSASAFSRRTSSVFSPRRTGITTREPGKISKITSVQTASTSFSRTFA